MARRVRGRTRSQRARHSEDCLADVEAIVIRLEGGYIAEFNIADEIRIPRNHLKLKKASYAAPDRLAFWLYQTARAKRNMREAERQYDLAYAKADSLQRHGMAEFSGEYTERVIRSLVEHTDYADVGADAKTKRKEWVEAEGQYELLRAMSVAMEHRTHSIRALTKAVEAEYMGGV